MCRGRGGVEPVCPAGSGQAAPCRVHQQLHQDAQRQVRLAMLSLFPVSPNHYLHFGESQKNTAGVAEPRGVGAAKGAAGSSLRRTGGREGPGVSWSHLCTQRLSGRVRPPSPEGLKPWLLRTPRPNSTVGAPLKTVGSTPENHAGSEITHPGVTPTLPPQGTTRPG